MEKNDDFSELMRQATVHADKGEWDLALGILAMLKERSKASPDAPGPGCKYPLYLSRAGHYEEAMREFDWLLEELPMKARRESALDDPTVFFAKGASKRKIYNMIIKNQTTEIEHARQVAIRRMEKASKK